MSDRRQTRWYGYIAKSPIIRFFQPPKALDAADPQIQNLPLLSGSVPEGWNVPEVRASRRGYTFVASGMKPPNP